MFPGLRTKARQGRLAAEQAHLQPRKALRQFTGAFDPAQAIADHQQAAATSRQPLELGLALGQRLVEGQLPQMFRAGQIGALADTAQGADHAAIGNDLRALWGEHLDLLRRWVPGNDARLHKLHPRPGQQRRQGRALDPGAGQRLVPAHPLLKMRLIGNQQDPRRGRFLAQARGGQQAGITATENQKRKIGHDGLHLRKVHPDETAAGNVTRRRKNLIEAQQGMAEKRRSGECAEKTEEKKCSPITSAVAPKPKYPLWLGEQGGIYAGSRLGNIGHIRKHRVTWVNI